MKKKYTKPVIRIITISVDGGHGPKKCQGRCHKGGS